MPPKAKLKEKDILNGALEEVREKGFGRLNARDLAKRLSCSTSPIFSCFGNMEGLKEAVVKRGFEIYGVFIEEGLKEEKGFKGVGKAYIRFARREPNLFRLLFMSAKKGTAFPSADPNAPRISDAAAAASELNKEKSEKLYLEMWIFVHGIASMIVTGTAEFTEEQIDCMLTDTFQGIKNKLKEEV